MQKVNQPEQELEQDFSKPWEHSDVILLVEGQQFHIHRAILAMSSPVFSRMFSADFKEKHAEEIPLPDKQVEEIREMLLAIYPNSWKPVDNKNCYFLLALAQEYQMTKLTKRCQDFLLQVVEKQQGADVLETLVVAQSYTLERVIEECVKKTQSLSFQELKSHEMYQKIEPLTQRKMIELQRYKVEEEVSKMKDLAATALSNCKTVIMMLGSHIRYANQSKMGWEHYCRSVLRRCTLKKNMEIIEKDNVGFGGHIGVCHSLSEVYRYLKDLHKSLMEMKPGRGIDSEDIELNSA